MSPIRVTCSRTIGMSRNLYSTALAVGGFLMACAAMFAFGLNAAEGSNMTLPIIFATSVSPLLPVLSAVLGMDVWSDERMTGRIDSLLTVSVKERDLVLGKFLGVWMITMLAVLLFMVTVIVYMLISAPTAFGGIRMFGFVAAFSALMVQGALWCAVTVAASALNCHAASAALVSVAITAVLPRCAWAAIMAWANEGRTAFGEMPIDAHVIDMASGFFSSGTVISYVVLTAFMLFVASKAVASLRCVGKGAMTLRVTTGIAVFLAAIATVLAVVLAVRLDKIEDFSIMGGEAGISARTRNVLAQSDGEMTITCFLSRKDRNARTINRFLRRLKAESDSVGGVHMILRYVDPRWDIGAAERLISKGAVAPCVVFERGRRTEMLALDDTFGERTCASAIRRTLTTLRRPNVYWTVGHGELSFDSYDNLGLSDIRRELENEGYHNCKIGLSADAVIPDDCALIVIAGARDDFSRAEIGRLNVYLKQGGRLLVLADVADHGGVMTVLPSWGIRPTARPIQGAKVLTGSEIIVSEFSGHAISSRLKGSQIVMESPLTLEPSAVADGAVGADKVEFAPLASVGQSAVAAVVERGLGAGSDLGIRPMRIVVLGDSSFVMNGPLSARANANRDFFMNCVSYLSGTDSVGASGAGPQMFVTKLDRMGRIRLVAVLAGIVPFSVFVIMISVVIVRRRRK